MQTLYSLLGSLPPSRGMNICASVDRGHIRWALGLIGAIGISLNADAGLFGLGGSTWKEEVLLHDGQKIIVQRSQTYGGRSEPGQAGPIREHSVSFTVPGTKKSVTWTSEYSEDLGRANFNLLALHVLKGNAYVVASPNLCVSYNKWGRPNPPYVIFKYEGEQWRRVALDALPKEFETINVVLSIQKFQADELSVTGLTSAEKTIEANRNSETPEFRRILREPLSKERIVELCGDRVLYKGHWIIPNSPTARSVIDSKQK